MSLGLCGWNLVAAGLIPGLLKLCQLPLLKNKTFSPRCSRISGVSVNHHVPMCILLYMISGGGVGGTLIKATPRAILLKVPTASHTTFQNGVGGALTEAHLISLS